MVFNLSSIDIDFASLELTLSPNELSNLTEDLNQTTIVDKLTQIIATLGVFICFFGILGNFLSIIVLSRKAMKKLSTYAYLLGLSVSDEISLIFTVKNFPDYSNYSILSAFKIFIYWFFVSLVWFKEKHLIIINQRKCFELIIRISFLLYLNRIYMKNLRGRKRKIL